MTGAEERLEGILAVRGILYALAFALPIDALIAVILLR